jgi:hypothetical protein
MRPGVGRRLMLDVEATVRSFGVTRVEVTANPHALAIDARAGFLVDGEV